MSLRAQSELRKAKPVTISICAYNLPARELLALAVALCLAFLTLPLLALLMRVPFDTLLSYLTEPVVLDQNGCMYKPHVLGVRVGQDLHIVSSDPTTHNIHPMPTDNREWNESQAPGAPPAGRVPPRARPRGRRPRMTNGGEPDVVAHFRAGFETVLRFPMLLVPPLLVHVVIFVLALIDILDQPGLEAVLDPLRLLLEGRSGADRGRELAGRRRSRLRNV